MEQRWNGDHGGTFIKGFQKLRSEEKLFDVILSAEGKSVKAHKVVLAAASTYFADLLTTSTELDDHYRKLPVIFLRDVQFQELQCLMDFIYDGETSVPPGIISSFTKLVREMGIEGFKRPDFDFKVAKEVLIGGKAFQSPSKNSLTASEPMLIQSPDTSQIKRRRMQCRSLDDDLENKICTPPSPFRSSIAAAARNRRRSSKPSTPLSPLVLSSLWSNAPLSLSPGEAPLTPNHTSHVSCPVDPVSPKQDTTSTSNMSFDNSALAMLDPKDLAAKGATLLHHLAVWMIEEKRISDEKEKEEEPTPSTSQGTSGLLTTPTKRMHRPSGRSLRTEGSEAGDRPDSGFDSKDEEEIKSGGSDSTTRGILGTHFQQVSQAISEESSCSGGIQTVSEGSSPDVTEISRQAPNRQPVRKRRHMP